MISDVQRREKQHDPMIMEWDFISEATTRLESLPVKRPEIISEASASSALEHASEEASRKVVRAEETPMPLIRIHASDNEPDYMTSDDDEEEMSDDDDEQMPDDDEEQKNNEEEQRSLKKSEEV